MEDNEDQLKKRCIELNNIELEIRIKQTELGKLKEQKKELEENIIPTMIKNHNKGLHKINENLWVDIERNYNLPSDMDILKAREEKRDLLVDRKNSALSWLRKNGGQHLIKNHVGLQFGRNEDEECNKFIEELDRRKLFYKISTEVYLPHLIEFLKKCESENKQIPDCFYDSDKKNKGVLRRNIENM